MVDIFHRFICGTTGSGKTYYARRMYEQSDRRCIFINTTEDLQVNRSSEFVSKDPKECLRALQDGAYKVCWTPQKQRDLRVIREFMFNVGNKINTEEIYHIFDLYIDECQEDWIGLRDIAVRGRRYGIRMIAITQRPALMNSPDKRSVVTQCNEHVIFTLGDYEKLYFDRYGIPYDEHKEFLAPQKGIDRESGEEKFIFPHTYIKYTTGAPAERFNPVD